MLAWWLAACTHEPTTRPRPTGEPTPTGGTGSPVPTADTGRTGSTGHTGHTGATDDPAAYEALFDPSVVHTVDLAVTDADWALVLAGTGQELLAPITLDGVALGGGSVRVKGDAADLGWPGKADLDLDLDDGGGAKVGGVEHLALHAQLHDPACAREVIAAEVLRAAGVRAPRAVFATVTIHGEEAGLYTLVEAVDRAFVRRRFADDSGDLWEGGDGADFSAPGVDAWHAVGGGGDRAKLDAVRAVVQSSPDFYADLQPLVDAADLDRFWSWVSAIGHDEGWPHRLKHVYTYADPTDAGRLVFVPWDLERAWDPEMVWSVVDSQLGVRCQYDDACLADLRAAVTGAADAVEALDVPALAEPLFAVSEPAVEADLARGTPVADVESARDELRGYLRSWPATLRAQVPAP